jgi:hypothetical protein
MLVDWFSEPIKEIFGMPSFWIARFAKAIQFLGGAIIVIEIIGKDRVEELAEVVRLRLSKISDAEPVKAAVNDLKENSKYLYLSIITLDKEKATEYRQKSNQMKSDLPAILLWLIMTVAVTIVFYQWQLEWGWGLLWKLPLTFVIAFFSTFFFVYLIVLHIIRFTIFIILRPVELVFDRIAKFIIRILEKTRVIKRLLIISFFLLVVGFILELLVT